MNYLYLMKPFFTLLIISRISFCCCNAQDGLINYDLDLGQLLASLSVPEENIHIEIDKSDYVLSIVSDSIILKQYPVVFGSNPVDDKLRQGDRCTPEGRFRVISKYPHPSWDKFIWVASHLKTRTSTSSIRTSGAGHG